LKNAGRQLYRTASAQQAYLFPSKLGIPLPAGPGLNSKLNQHLNLRAERGKLGNFMAPILQKIAAGLCVFLLAGSVAHGEEEPAREASNPKEIPGQSAPEKAQDKDIFLLKNGDRMQGTFESLADHQIHFQDVSLDEIALGDLVLEFADIVQVQFRAENTFDFPNKKKLVGVAKISGDTITVQTQEREERLPRSDLVSITKGSISELDLWSGGASVGLTKNSGNSNELQLLVLAHLVREGEKVRFRTNYRNDLSKTNDVDTVKNQRLDARIDLLIRDRLYLTPAMLDYYSDEFQNIDWRLSPGAGAGYEIVQSKKAEWDANLALVYQETHYVSVFGTQSIQENAVALKLQTHFKLAFNSYVTLHGDYSLTADLEDTQDITQHSLIKLKVDMSRHLDLNLAFVWDRVGDPQANALGVVPKKDDFKISFGAGVHF